MKRPRGATLNLICTALGTSTKDILDYAKVVDKRISIFLHLSVLLYVVIPVGNIIIPLIVWLVHRNKVIGIDAKEKSLLNFQITWTVVTMLSMFAIMTIKKTYPLDEFIFSRILLLLFIALNLPNVFLAIFFAGRAGKKSINAYPSIVPFII